MDFDIIPIICQEKKITIPELSEKIGMSRAGLYTTLKNKTLTISNLEKIAIALKVPITVFFSSEVVDEEIEEKLREYDTVKELYEKSEKEVERLNIRQDDLTELIRSKRSTLRSLYYQLKEHDNSGTQLSVERIREILKVINESEKFEETDQILKDRQAERKQRELEGKSKYELQKELNDRMKKRLETDIPTKKDEKDKNNTK